MKKDETLIEIDEPLAENMKNNSERLIDAQEKESARKEKRYYSAFKLIAACLIFLGIIYILDLLVNALAFHEPSGITNSIVEIIKTLLFTLSGYLFAKKENGD